MKAFRLPDSLKTFLFIVLMLLFVFGGAKVLEHYHYEQIDAYVKETYEIRKEKCELLRTIADDFIEEGKGINYAELSKSKIDYEISYQISNDGDNIIFYYYIEEPDTTERTYNARITLSNDFHILQEEYSVELQDYNSYKRTESSSLTLLASSTLCMLWGFVTVAIAVCRIIYTLIGKCIKYKKAKKHRSKPNN